MRAEYLELSRPMRGSTLYLHVPVKPDHSSQGLDTAQVVPADGDVESRPVEGGLPAVDVNPGHETKSPGDAVVTPGAGHHEGRHLVTILPPHRYRAGSLLWSLYGLISRS